MDRHVLPPSASPYLVLDISKPPSPSPDVAINDPYEHLFTSTAAHTIMTTAISSPTTTHSTQHSAARPRPALADLIHRENAGGWENNVEAHGPAEAGRSVCFPSSSHSSPVKDAPPLPRAVEALRSRHTRTRSASSAMSAREKTLRSSPSRTRALSTSTTVSLPLKPSFMHTMSLSRATAPQAKPVLSLDTDAEETIGSFSPTNSPRRHLHEILESSKPTSRLRFNSLRGTGMRLKLPWALDITADGRKVRSLSQSDSDESHPTSPISPIPSICRTPSSYSESEYFPTAPSSAGPATPVHSNSSSPELHHKSLRPILEALEDASKFRVRTSCASCHKKGSNFPCCPRCGEMWCSRDCRMRSTGGKRHVCQARS
ncbi:hypothetical protein BDW22DRAFT_913902 [Trametopsis cervina]|nr:hypothetical protein BDW22DRAFT_913902 [Trametopsis cervina]